MNSNIRQLLNFFKLTSRMKQKHKTPCKQQWINLEMQRQINMLNLTVEFRLELFDMKILFQFKLRVSAGMIENLKTRSITPISTTFRSTEMFKNVGTFSFLTIN